jgi:hypothetical protein
MPGNVNFGIKGSTVRQFLTSSGLPTKLSSRKYRMSNKILHRLERTKLRWWCVISNCIRMLLLVKIQQGEICMCLDGLKMLALAAHQSL